MQGQWVFKLKPKADELLSSWMIRNAHAHGLNAYRFFNLLMPEIPIWNRDIDRSVSDKMLRQLSQLSSYPVSALAEHTLRSYERRLTGNIGKRSRVPLILSLGVYHRMRANYGLQYCSQCLKESAYFRRQWRLAFYVYCHHHLTLLRDCCPLCGAMMQPHRAESIEYCSNCHACLSRYEAPNEIDFDIYALQNFLMKNLDSIGSAKITSSSKHRSDILSFMRVLLGFLSENRYRQMVSKSNYFNQLDIPFCARYFESTRIDGRIKLLGALQQWLGKMPISFYQGAEILHLTRNSLSRYQKNVLIKIYMSKLPAGRGHYKVRRPAILTQKLKCLRRNDPFLYRKTRAKAILNYLYQHDG